MWRLMAVLVCVVLATGVAACGSDEGSGEDKPAESGAKELSGKIAVLLPDTKSSDRWEKADRRFFGEAFRAAGLSDDDFIISNAQGDPATQRTQAEQAVTEGAKVILLTNLDSGSGAAIIGASKAQGVTMIDYDRLTLNGDADYYVSGDATEAGRLQGQGLVDDLEKAGTKSARDRDAARRADRLLRHRPAEGLQGGAEAEDRLRRVHARGRAGGAELGRSAGAHDLRADAPEDQQQDRRRRRRQRHARQRGDLRHCRPATSTSCPSPGSTRPPGRCSTSSPASSR